MLAVKGISIGIPRSVAAEHFQLFPHSEIEVRRESLPTLEASRFILEHSHGDLVWHVTIDELHESKMFASDDLPLFVRTLEENSPERHTLVLAFDRTAEYDAKILDQIEAFRDSVTSIPVLLDTEHPSWKSTRIQAILKSLKLPHVFLDAPNLPGIVKDASYHTGRTAMLRCLGRNSRTVFEHKKEIRFEYSYTNEELRTISKRVKQLRQVYDKVFVTFCNRPGEQAIQNSIQFSGFLA